MRSPWPAFCENSRFKTFKTPSRSFEGAILLEMPLVAAVDGKTAKPMKDENGDPIHMLKERTLKEVRERCHANPKKTAKKLGLA